MTRGIVWAGPSELDGQPIVMIATDRTSNRKTGNLIQTWILRADVSPVEAVRSGADVSVCGDCPLRNAGCYVVVVDAPRAVWAMWKRGGYGLAELPRNGVRMGAYGDPAAVPVSVWKAWTSRASMIIGYTAQWRRFPAFKSLCMASVRSEQEA